MPKFRKKPIVIEAEQFRSSINSLPFSRRGDPCCLGPKGWYIATLEGEHALTEGDWVICGVKGEFYPCKPDIFAATYGPAEERSAPPAPAGDETATIANEVSRLISLYDRGGKFHVGELRLALKRHNARAARPLAAAEPVLHAEMHCPKCSVRHVDEGEWSMRLHHKHLCAACGFIWRVEPYTFGVASPAAEGAADVLDALKCAREDLTERHQQYGPTGIDGEPIERFCGGCCTCIETLPAIDAALSRLTSSAARQEPKL